MTLPRKKQLKRSRPKNRTLRRDWSDADKKMVMHCRGCDEEQRWWVERAHLVPRRFDEVRKGARGAKYLYVSPDNIVPLCIECHCAFDAGLLSLIGKLTMREYRHVIRILGKARARRRLGGGRP